MELILVRHGQSEGNAAGRMQGRRDSPLTERGRDQARLVGAWLRQHDLRWAAAYASPLRRAQETAEIVSQESGFAAPTLDPDLREIAAGELEGLSREEILERFPAYKEKEITDLGDFSDVGGESYEDVQKRVRHVVSRLEEHHRASGDRVLLVAHGGLLFQLLKAVISVPVPRVSVVRWGNCTASHVRFLERRGLFMGELTWHVPIELMGGVSVDGPASIFR